MRRVIPLLLLLPSCATVPIREYVRDAADRRDVVCALADAAESEDSAAVQKVRALCKTDADLQTIAAAYAGCEE